jgi:molybdopterin synthase sulfur carrier subunit
VSTVTVRYFASLREHLGTDRETVAVPPDGTALSDLLELLATCHGEAAIEQLTGPGVRIAVNDALVEEDPGRLAPGDVIAFLPPVTGG